MRIYLDCCCLQRPFDDQTQPRIRVEAEAVLAILALVQGGEVQLLASDVLAFEINRTPEPKRRDNVLALLSIASESIALDNEILEFAKSLEKLGAKAADALHLATASHAHADYFSSCDDRLLSKRSIFIGLQCKIVSVLELVTELAK